MEINLLILDESFSVEQLITLMTNVAQTLPADYKLRVLGKKVKNDKAQNTSIFKKRLQQWEQFTTNEKIKEIRKILRTVDDAFDFDDEFSVFVCLASALPQCSELTQKIKETAIFSTIEFIRPSYFIGNEEVKPFFNFLLSQTNACKKKVIDEVDAALSALLKGDVAGAQAAFEAKLPRSQEDIIRRFGNKDIPYYYLMVGSAFLEHNFSFEFHETLKERELLQSVNKFLTSSQINLDATLKSGYTFSGPPEKKALTDLRSQLNQYYDLLANYEAIRDAKDEGSRSKVIVDLADELHDKILKLSVGKSFILPAGYIGSGDFRTQDSVWEHEGAFIIERKNSVFFRWVYVDPGSAYHPYQNTPLKNKSRVICEIDDVPLSHICPELLKIIITLRTVPPSNPTHHYTERHVYELVLAKLNGKTVFQDIPDEYLKTHREYNGGSSWYVIKGVLFYLLNTSSLGPVFYKHLLFSFLWEQMEYVFRLFLQEKPTLTFLKGEQYAYLLEEFISKLSLDALKIQDSSINVEEACLKAFTEKTRDIKATLQQWKQEIFDAKLLSNTYQLDPYQELAFKLPEKLKENLDKLGQVSSILSGALPAPRISLQYPASASKFSALEEARKKIDSLQRNFSWMNVQKIMVVIESLVLGDLLNNPEPATAIEEWSDPSVMQHTAAVMKHLYQLGADYYNCHFYLAYRQEGEPHDPVNYGKLVILLNALSAMSEVAMRQSAEPSYSAIIAPYCLSHGVSNTLSILGLANEFIIQESPWDNLLHKVVNYFSSQSGKKLFPMFDSQYISNKANEDNTDIAFAVNFTKTCEPDVWERFEKAFEDYTMERAHQKWAQFFYTSNYLPTVICHFRDIAYLSHLTFLGFSWSKIEANGSKSTALSIIRNQTFKQPVGKNLSDYYGIYSSSSTFIYFDSYYHRAKSGYYGVDMIPDAARFSGYVLPGASAELQRLVYYPLHQGALNKKAHLNENELIASQSEQPRDLTKIDYFNLGFLQATPRLVLRRLYLALKKEILSFEVEAHCYLIKQALFQIKEREGNGQNLLSMQGTSSILGKEFIKLLHNQIEVLEHRPTQYKAMGCLLELLMGLNSFWGQKLDVEIHQAINAIRHCLKKWLLNTDPSAERLEFAYLSTFLILSYRLSPLLSDDDVLALLTARYHIELSATFNMLLPSALYFQMSRVLIEKEEMLDNFLSKNPKLISCLCEEVKIFPKEKAWHYSPKEGLYQSGDAHFDPLRGRFYSQGFPLQLLSDIYREPDYKAALGETIFPVMFHQGFYEEQSAAVHPYWRLQWLPRASNVKLRIEEWDEERNTYGVFVASHYLRGTLPEAVLRGYTHWQVGNEILIKTGLVGPKKRKLIYRWDLTTGLLYDASKEIFLLPFHQQTNGNTALQKALSRFENPSEILVSSTYPEPAVVQNIYFPRLGLSFKREAQLLECNELKGYQLASAQCFKGFDGLENYLLLEKQMASGDKQQCVVIPHRVILEREVFYSNTIELFSEILLDPPYFVYQINPRLNRLEAETRAGQLYLALLYTKIGSLSGNALTGDHAYETASQLLDRCWQNEPYEGLELSILRRFLALTCKEQLGQEEVLGKNYSDSQIDAATILATERAQFYSLAANRHYNAIAIWLKALYLMTESLGTAFLRTDKRSLQARENNDKTRQYFFVRYFPEYFARYLSLKNRVHSQCRLTDEEERNLWQGYQQVIASSEQVSAVRFVNERYGAHRLGGLYKNRYLNEAILSRYFAEDKATTISSLNYKDLEETLFSKSQLDNISFTSDINKLLMDKISDWDSGGIKPENVKWPAGIEETTALELSLQNFWSLYHHAQKIKTPEERYAFECLLTVLAIKFNTNTLSHYQSALSDSVAGLYTARDEKLGLGAEDAYLLIRLLYLVAQRGMGFPYLPLFMYQVDQLKSAYYYLGRQIIKESEFEECFLKSVKSHYSSLSKEDKKKMRTHLWQRFEALDLSGINLRWSLEEVEDANFTFGFFNDASCQTYLLAFRQELGLQLLKLYRERLQNKAVCAFIHSIAGQCDALQKKFRFGKEITEAVLNKLAPSNNVRSVTFNTVGLQQVQPALSLGLGNFSQHCQGFSQEVATWFQTEDTFLENVDFPFNVSNVQNANNPAAGNGPARGGLSAGGRGGAAAGGGRGGGGAGSHGAAPTAGASPFNHIGTLESNYGGQFTRQLQASWDEYRRVAPQRYRLGASFKIEDVEVALKQKQEEFLKDRQGLTEAINTLLSAVPENRKGYEFILAQNAGRMSVSNRMRILSAFLSGESLHELQPFLIPSSKENLRKLIENWVLCQSLLDQIARGLELMAQYASKQASPDEQALLFQNIAATLCAKRTYTPSERPHWLLFELENDLLIRPIQDELTRKMSQAAGMPLNNSPEVDVADGNVMYQLNMGEGKSSVILILLAQQLADGNKVVRVNVLEPLLAVMKSLLSQKYGGLLTKRIYVMPFSREVEISEANLSKILQELRYCKEHRHVVLVTPEHRLSFRLRWEETLLEYAALKEANDKVNWLTINEEYSKYYKTYREPELSGRRAHEFGARLAALQEKITRLEQQHKEALKANGYLDVADVILKPPPHGRVGAYWDFEEEVMKQIKQVESYYYMKCIYDELLRKSCDLKTEMRRKLGLFEEINQLGFCDVLDESDEILRYGKELNYTFGSRERLDGGAVRWQVPQWIFNIIFRNQDFVPLLEEGTENGKLEFSQGRGQTGGVPHVCFSDKQHYDSVLKPKLITTFLADIRSEIGEQAFDAIATRLASRTYGLHPNLEVFTLQDFILGNKLEKKEVVADFLEYLGTRVLDRDSPLLAIFLAARGWFSRDIIYHVMSGRYRVNYGFNGKGGALPTKKVAVPFYGNDAPAERSDFGHPDVMLGFTMLSYLYRGLTQEEVQRAFLRLKEHYSEEANHKLAEWVKVSRNWIIACEEEDWQKAHPQDSLSPNIILPIPEWLTEFKKVELEHPKYLAALARYFSHNPDVVYFYLEHYVFPDEAKQYKEKLMGNADNLVSEGITIGFSGTNDQQLTQPVRVQFPELKDQKATNGKMLHIVGRAKNQVYRMIEHADVKALLAKVGDYVGSPEGYDCCILLDAGALVVRMSNLEVAQTLLVGNERRLPQRFKGVIYFDDGTGKIVVLEENRKSVPLASCRLSKEELFVYLDEIHTRGTDLKLPLSARGIVTIGKGMQKDKFMQAVMRLRQLESSQSFEIWGPKDISQQIAGLNDVTIEQINSQHVVRWATFGTIKGVEKNFYSAALQKINYVYKEKAFEYQQLEPWITYPETLFIDYFKAKLPYTLREFYGTAFSSQAAGLLLGRVISYKETTWEENLRSTFQRIISLFAERGELTDAERHNLTQYLTDDTTPLLANSSQRYSQLGDLIYRALWNNVVYSDKTRMKDEINNIQQNIADLHNTRIAKSNLGEEQHNEIEVEIQEVTKPLPLPTLQRERNEKDWSFELITAPDFVAYCASVSAEPAPYREGLAILPDKRLLPGLERLAQAFTGVDSFKEIQRITWDDGKFIFVTRNFKETVTDSAASTSSKENYLRPVDCLLIVRDIDNGRSFVILLSGYEAGKISKILQGISPPDGNVRLLHLSDINQHGCCGATTLPAALCGEHLTDNELKLLTLIKLFNGESQYHAYEEPWLLEAMAVVNNERLAENTHAQALKNKAGEVVSQLTNNHYLTYSGFFTTRLERNPTQADSFLTGDLEDLDTETNIALTKIVGKSIVIKELNQVSILDVAALPMTFFKLMEVKGRRKEYKGSTLEKKVFKTV